MNTASKSTQILLFLFLFLGISTAANTYQLVWSDEFDGNVLDSTKWQKEVNCDGGGNNELQCYTDRASNVEVSGGFLKVTAKPETYNGKSYTSGRINTKGKAAWKYGRFDIKAKLPKGDYLWPALWMLPRDSVYGGWAASGEIDIMEARGQLNKQTSATLHYGGSWPNNVYKGSGGVNYDFDFSEDFHVFSCLWEADQIQFLVDGTVFYTADLNQNFFSGKGKSPYNANRQPFDQPFFFLINLAVGGGFFGAESNSLTAAAAQKWASPQLVVDYVRVYQKTDSSAIVPPPAPVPSTSSTQSPVKDTACVNKCNGQSCCNDQKLGVVCYNPTSYGCPVDLSTGKHSLCGGGLNVCGGICFDGSRYECTASGLVQITLEVKPTVDLPSVSVLPEISIDVSQPTKAEESNNTEESITEVTRTQANLIGEKSGGKSLVLSLFAIVLGLFLVL